MRASYHHRSRSACRAAALRVIIERWGRDRLLLLALLALCAAGACRSSVTIPGSSSVPASPGMTPPPTVVATVVAGTTVIVNKCFSSSPRRREREGLRSRRRSCGDDVGGRHHLASSGAGDRERIPALRRSFACACRFGAGRFEIRIPVIAVPSNGLLSVHLDLPVAYAYGSQTSLRRAQVVHGSELAALTIEGTVTAPAWNGTSGGIVAIGGDTVDILVGT